MEIIVNWFILVLVSVFDPLAVSLVIAANHLTHKENEKKIQSNTDNLKPQIQEKQNEIILEEVSEKKIETEPEELNGTINDQITDSVTVKPKENQKKIKKEKKDLENTEENVILNQSTSKVEEDFYDELPWVNGYRRGRKN
jgi:gas vesicle protein